MCRTGGIPLRVQKSSSVLDELFCILCTLKMTSRAGKYDLTSFLVVNLSVFPQRTFTKFGAAGVCILAVFVVKYIQSIYTLQT